MAKTNYIELGDGEQIPILYEDRSVLAIDKPPGWMLVPVSWQKTDRNLHAAILSSIEERAFWARCRNIKFLRHVHRLDAETSGILLFVKSIGAIRPYTHLFESREVEKRYLVVVEGKPNREEWTCRHPLMADPHQIGRVRVDSRDGKPAITRFRFIDQLNGVSLLEAFPVTGRTHQIRVHAAESGCPVVGDPLYGRRAEGGAKVGDAMGLRSVFLSYKNPFDRQVVKIKAPSREWLKTFGFREDKPQGAASPTVEPPATPFPRAKPQGAAGAVPAPERWRSGGGATANRLKPGRAEGGARVAKADHAERATKKRVR
ncbi:MAG: RluA family pseudouridine synthase [Verrucomicrobia bacterium]|nr:RluA family pseudouridine synthase [Verrucomicrobiota bacterium]